MTNPNQDPLDPRFARYLLESMADDVFTLNRAGEITSWNASEKISGYSARWTAKGEISTRVDGPIL